MKRWQQYSDDPNAVEIYALRQKYIGAARSTPVVDRIRHICELAIAKKVLDVGVVEHTSAASHSENWLHVNLVRVARECVGVDIIEKEVNRLRAQGFNVICSDVSHAPLPDTFDLIVVGEVLEHVDNAGSFLNNCGRMLNSGGRLVLTTPNPWYLNAIVKSVFGREPFVDSADHVAWYEPSVVFELAQRQGLRLVKYSAIIAARPRGIAGKALFGLRRVLALFVRPEVFAKSILYEFVKEEVCGHNEDQI